MLLLSGPWKYLELYQCTLVEYLDGLLNPPARSVHPALAKLCGVLVFL